MERLEKTLTSESKQRREQFDQAQETAQAQAQMASEDTNSRISAVTEQLSAEIKTLTERLDALEASFSNETKHRQEMIQEANAAMVNTIDELRDCISKESKDRQADTKRLLLSLEKHAFDMKTEIDHEKTLRESAFTPIRRELESLTEIVYSSGEGFQQQTRKDLEDINVRISQETVARETQHTEVVDSLTQSIAELQQSLRTMAKPIL